MPMRVARSVVVNSDQRRELMSRARSASARSVERAKILLLSATGMQDKQVAAALKITPEKAARWRNRYLDFGLAGLEKDAPRSGRTPVIGPAKIEEVVRMTTRDKLRNATHWSARAMAEASGLSEKTIRRICSAVLK